MFVASRRKRQASGLRSPERIAACANDAAGAGESRLRNDEFNDWAASDEAITGKIAGNVICRQRPGTAKGFAFISLEDETGVSNAIVDPNLFERFRLLIIEEAFLLIEGEVQNSDSVVLIKTRDIKALPHEQLVGSESHDFR